MIYILNNILILKIVTYFNYLNFIIMNFDIFLKIDFKFIKK